MSVYEKDGLEKLFVSSLKGFLKTYLIDTEAITLANNQVTKIDLDQKSQIVRKQKEDLLS